MKKEYDFSRGKRGPIIKSSRKTRITIYLDDDVIEAFKDRAEQSGMGYQTLINEALRRHLATEDQPLDQSSFRKILREELKRAG
jgi:uncharacterized protein (DUF4415 family)